MRSSFKIVQAIKRALLITGLLLPGNLAPAHIHHFMTVRVGMARVEASMHSIQEQMPSPPAKAMRGRLTAHAPDRALWSVQRVKAYEASLKKHVKPLALLRISALNLEIPVLRGTDEFTLNRGVGTIRNTSLPGQAGNIGIAGHRDGFFRVLKDIKKGDTISLVTLRGTRVYMVDQIRIIDRRDNSVLKSHGKSSLTLVTCYPFYFNGHAPQRYIVEASLKK